jgi:hypothetical protein
VWHFSLLRSTGGLDLASLPPLETDLLLDPAPLPPGPSLPRPLPLPDLRPRRDPAESFCLYLSSYCSSVRYNLSPSRLSTGTSLSSAALSQLVISSTDKCVESNIVSMEITNCLYLGRAMQRYLSMILWSGSTSPSVAS